MASSILITLPKSVAVPAFRDYAGNDSQSEISAKSRKRRLDHLSWDEKLQRKKLKNRVAAQTSRDRKKAKMEEMEDAIKELHAKNESLMREYRKLRETNRKLMNENADLHSKLSGAGTGCGCRCQGQSRPVDCTPSEGPAASTDPPPKDRGVPSAAALARRRLQTSLLMVNLLLSWLLCKASCPSSTPTSTLTSLRNSLRVCFRRSPQTSPLKHFLQKERIGQIIYKKIKQEKWWGRHQCNWNPVDTSA